MQPSIEPSRSLSSQTVGDLAIAPVRTIADTELIATAADELQRIGVSALPVVDRSGRLVGVISRTDLIRAGRVRGTDGWRRQVLNLPDVRVHNVMSPSVEVVTPKTPLREVARRMLQGHLHRLYVSEDRVPTGVLGTKELMAAVADARVPLPVRELMQRLIVVVDADAPLSLAIDRMALAQHSGLVVVEDGWPIAFFTQADALFAREAPPDARVDQWLDPRMICVPMAMPLFRAAEQAIATRARRILIFDAQGVRGMLTGLDFARFLQE